MFGYHNSNHCIFDLWAPIDYDNTAIENRSFSAYCFHTQEIENAINAIASGSTSIDCTDDMNDEDIAYIEKELYNRYGMTIHIS